MQALRAPATAHAFAAAQATRGARCAPASPVAARVVLRGAGAEQLALAKQAGPSRWLCRARRHQRGAASCAAAAARDATGGATLKALLWDCDGVILESEDLHRRAYNAVFKHYDVLVDGKVVYWSEEYYDMLSNTVGGGKPKMRWHFGKVGWPSSSSVLNGPCVSDEQKDKLIDTLQDWKTNHYEELIKSGQVETRPGVLRLMDEARAAGLKVAVCSAATKSAAVTTVSSLLGEKRWNALDCFLAGNDVAKLKPDPLIYNTACAKLGLKASECIVIEDSTVGLKAATAAGMRCIITYTSTGKGEPFAEAAFVVNNLDVGGVTVQKLLETHASNSRFDDRK